MNIENLELPYFASKFLTFGGETLVKGKYAHKEYAFLADGLQGVAVIDQRKLPLITIISRFYVRGYSNHVALLFNELFALVSTTDLGQTTLIDIRSITTPSLISTF